MVTWLHHYMVAAGKRRQTMVFHGWESSRSGVGAPLHAGFGATKKNRALHIWGKAFREIGLAVSSLKTMSYVGFWRFWGVRRRVECEKDLDATFVSCW